MTNDEKGALNRRGFLGVSAGGAALPLVAGAVAASAPAQAQASAAPDARTAVNVTLSVNGRNHQLALDGRTTLLDALRDHVGLTGTKKGCDHGQCGACTVLIDGRRVLSCLTLAAMAEAQEVTTIEGLAAPNGDAAPDAAGLHRPRRLPVRLLHAGPDHVGDRPACKEGHAETDADIREYMSGNLCRCAAYPNIVAAIKQAKRRDEEA